jgi:hypothetical protein
MKGAKGGYNKATDLTFPDTLTRQHAHTLRRFPSDPPKLPPTAREHGTSSVCFREALLDGPPANRFRGSKSARMVTY